MNGKRGSASRRRFGAARGCGLETAHGDNSLALILDECAVKNSAGADAVEGNGIHEPTSTVHFNYLHCFGHCVLKGKEASREGTVRVHFGLHLALLVRY